MRELGLNTSVGRILSAVITSKNIVRNPSNLLYLAQIQIIQPRLALQREHAFILKLSVLQGRVEIHQRDKRKLISEGFMGIGIGLQFSVKFVGEITKFKK